MRRISSIFSLPILLSTLAVPAADATPVTVVVNGTTYTVDYFTGSFQANQGLFNATYMPWWGNQPLSVVFAAAVGAGLDAPNLGGTTGPLFARGKNLDDDILYAAYDISGQNAFNSFTGPADSHSYAQLFNGGGAVPEIDALAGTGALTLLGFGLALAGERRRQA